MHPNGSGARTPVQGLAPGGEHPELVTIGRTLTNALIPADVDDVPFSRLDSLGFKGQICLINRWLIFPGILVITGSLDQLMFGQLVTPEPATLGLLATGLLGVGWITRRRSPRRAVRK